MSAFRRLVRQWLAADTAARPRPTRTRLGLTALETREVPASLAGLLSHGSASFNISAATTHVTASPTLNPILLNANFDPIKRAAELSNRFDVTVVIPANPSLDKGEWFPAGDGIGKVQYFSGGVLLWSQATGIHAVAGAAYQAWNAAGGLAAFGYPTTELTAYGAPQKLVGRDQYAVYQSFQRGTLSSPPVGAISATTGPLNAAYVAAGGPTGPLGAATASVASGNGGQFARFERGAIAWTAASGARVLNGAIADLWLNIDRGGGPVGFPTGDETPAGTGRMQTFQRGIITNSGATGAHEVHGAILGEYLANGGPGGFLGLPTTNELTAPDGVGRYNHFQGGSVYWSPSTGAHEVHGAIRDKWAAMGWENSPLGYPISGETAGPNGSRFSTFQNGVIYWSAATGAHALSGAVLDKYLAWGGPGGRLGLPITDADAVNGTATRVAFFQKGVIVSEPGRPAVALSGPIFEEWVRIRGYRGRIGLPTSDEPATGTVRTVTFTGGSLTWTAGKGVTSVQLRGNFEWHRYDRHASRSGMDAAQRLLVAWGMSSIGLQDPSNSGRLTRWVLDHYELDATPQEVTDALRKVRGGAQLYHDASFDFLTSTLKTGRPVLVLVNTWGAFSWDIPGSPRLAYQLLTGIDTANQTLTYTDGNRPQTISYGEFLKQWNWSADRWVGDYLTGYIGVKSRTMIYYAG